jgi:hypothetical protein
MKDRKFEQEYNEFEEIVRPVIKYMAEKHHPHTTLIIDALHAELVEGVMVLSTKDYLID